MTRLPDVYPRFFHLYMCALTGFEEKLSPPKNSYGSIARAWTMREVIDEWCHLSFLYQYDHYIWRYLWHFYYFINYIHYLYITQIFRNKYIYNCQTGIEFINTIDGKADMATYFRLKAYTIPPILPIRKLVFILILIFDYYESRPL